MSDGSPFLYFWDAESLQEKRKVEVTRLLGKSQNMLNELEYMDGLVCCNIWHADQIICVDPQDGKSVREYSELFVRVFIGAISTSFINISLFRL